MNLPERFLIRVPEGADPKLAVALVLDWVTAWNIAVSALQVKAGLRELFLLFVKDRGRNFKD